ncbi:MAG: hypothetical protein WBQ94_02470 [Terracidiphilus sp.]
MDSADTNAKLTPQTRARHLFQAAALVVLLVAWCSPPASTQDKQPNGEGMVVTVNEFQEGSLPPAGSYSTCINVWEDGRFHLERRRQQLPSATATLQVFDSTLPVDELEQLQNILKSDPVLRLQPLGPLSNSEAKTWVRGMIVRIFRDKSMRKVGYFEWETNDASAVSQLERKLVVEPQLDAKEALKPLSEWLSKVNSAKLTPTIGEPTMCAAPGNE